MEQEAVQRSVGSPLTNIAWNGNPLAWGYCDPGKLSIGTIPGIGNPYIPIESIDGTWRKKYIFPTKVRRKYRIMKTNVNLLSTTQLKRYVPKLVTTFLVQYDEYDKEGHGVYFDADSQGMFI